MRVLLLERFTIIRCHIYFVKGFLSLDFTGSSVLWFGFGGKRRRLGLLIQARRQSGIDPGKFNRLGPGLALEVADLVDELLVFAPRQPLVRLDAAVVDAILADTVHAGALGVVDVTERGAVRRERVERNGLEVPGYQVS